MSCRILIGDCRERLRELPDNSVDSVVCDPPYHLTQVSRGGSRRQFVDNPYGRTRIGTDKGFMGQTWDGGDVAFDPETWAEVLRVLKPGGHLVAFSGTRTYHRMAVAIEDAGFEVRDMIAWHYGSGFPKSHDISKAIDKAAGAEREVVGFKPSHRPNRVGERGGSMAAAYTDAVESIPATDAAREWEGWGTALKPATEPICLARKPLSEKSIAANVLKWGTGALNIDGCRIEGESTERHTFKVMTSKGAEGGAYGKQDHRYAERDDKLGTGSPLGRWPANLCHDGSDEVVAGFPAEVAGASSNGKRKGNGYGEGFGNMEQVAGYADSGSAARFFYCAKATTDERGEGNNHPTVKPVALMRWLVRLVTPKGGTVLDPFMGSGSTALACDAEQFDFIGCEMSPEYAAIAERRIRDAAGMFADVKVAA